MTTIQNFDNRIYVLLSAGFIMGLATCLLNDLPVRAWDRALASCWN